MSLTGLKGLGLVNTFRITLALICLLPALAFSQEVEVKAGFLSESLKIGEQTAFYLTVRYPSDLTVLFPDSTHAFTPFEYQSKEYFLTRTENGVSADSAVYFLTRSEERRGGQESSAL